MTYSAADAEGRARARAVQALLSASAALPGDGLEETLNPGSGRRLGGLGLDADETALLLRKVLYALQLHQK